MCVCVCVIFYHPCLCLFFYKSSKHFMHEPFFYLFFKHQVPSWMVEILHKAKKETLFKYSYLCVQCCSFLVFLQCLSLTGFLPKMVHIFIFVPFLSTTSLLFDSFFIHPLINLFLFVIKESSNQMVEQWFVFILCISWGFYFQTLLNMEDIKWKILLHFFFRLGAGIFQKIVLCNLFGWIIILEFYTSVYIKENEEEIEKSFHHTFKDF